MKFKIELMLAGISWAVGLATYSLVLHFVYGDKALLFNLVQILPLSIIGFLPAFFLILVPVMRFLASTLRESRRFWPYPLLALAVGFSPMVMIWGYAFLAILLLGYGVDSLFSVSYFVAPATRPLYFMFAASSLAVGAGFGILKYRERATHARSV
ncbi:MAG TPA: hypothetical protein VEX43_11840 [Chthoniobacterales bacterium]|nr:hypothetical protein [Chthoniobacterales bacterium]